MGHMVDLVPSRDSSEEDDVLLVEVFCVDLVGWWHAVAVGEARNICLDLGLGVRTEALGLQMSLELKGAGALGVGRDGGRLHGGLVGLSRRHGWFLKIWRVGGAVGGGGLSV